ncbi:hypothetical protein DRN51_06595 [Thermococci archaeon]|nr:MAG: hypothetical protein DRN51_06595 [Thermococci archaeon]
MYRTNNYQDLEFIHFVIDKTGTIFGSARERGGRIANFLINGWIKQQTGDYWQELEPEPAQMVKDRATGAYGRVPTYRTERLLF